MSKTLDGYDQALRDIANDALTNPHSPQYKRKKVTGRHMRDGSQRIKVKANKYRAVAVVTERPDSTHWHWYFLGTHAEYDKLF